MRILGVDPGSRRIGLALSDEGGRIAMPLSTIERSGRAAAVAAIAQVVAEKSAGLVIVGLPLRLDGSEGPEARRARELASEIHSAAGVPVELVDERFTTAAAERALSATGVRGKKKKKVVDQAAATVLLQGYLDGKEPWDGDDKGPR